MIYIGIDTGVHTGIAICDNRKRSLEIATTLAMEPELMLLDEPTQGMGHEDVERVAQLIKRVSAGRTIFRATHLRSQMRFNGTPVNSQMT